MKRIKVGKLIYEFNAAFKAGAAAAFASKAWEDNPHKNGTQALDDWDAGYHAAKIGLVSAEMEILKGEVK
jgi:hypothetical protein